MKYLKISHHCNTRFTCSGEYLEGVTVEVHFYMHHWAIIPKKDTPGPCLDTFAADVEYLCIKLLPPTRITSPKKRLALHVGPANGDVSPTKKRV